MTDDLHTKPPTFTMDEARRKIALNECKASGHDFGEVREGLNPDPIKLVCARCHDSWSLVKRGAEA